MTTGSEDEGAIHYTSRTNWSDMPVILRLKLTWQVSASVFCQCRIKIISSHDLQPLGISIWNGYADLLKRYHPWDFYPTTLRYH
jgi:hypothetical protein